MALTDKLQRRVRVRKDEAENQDAEEDLYFGEDSTHDEGSTSEDNSLNIDDANDDDDGGDQEEEGSSSNEDQREDEESLSPQSPLPQDSLTNISFGALAAAQNSLSHPLKRKRSPQPIQDTPQDSSFAEAFERRAGKKDHRIHSRSSKHAPTVLSSKKAVSRKRSILPTPTIVHRDPRFNPLSGPLATEKVARNYSFLDAYRASEIGALKSAIRNTHDEIVREELQKTLKSMESKQQSQAVKDIQQEVIREHRRKEKDAVEKGKRPFYLKKGEQRKLALVKRFEGLGEKKVERVIEKRRKKKAAREKKGMPFGRRGTDTRGLGPGKSGEDPSGKRGA